MKFGLLLWAALPLAAQLQVFTVQDTALVPVAASFNLGTVSVRDSAEYRFRAVNTGTAPLPLQTVAVGGSGFALTLPFVPLTLAPAQSYDFSVRFTPASEGSYSATLTVNSFSSFLRVSAIPGPVLYLDNGDGLTEISVASLRVNVALGTTLTVPLVAANPYTAPLLLPEISLSGNGFTFSAPPPGGATTLEPGQRIPLPVRIAAPAAEGEVVGVVTVGPRRLILIASIFRQPLPVPRIVLNNAAPQNSQQLRIRLQLAEPAIAPGSGTLRAVFTGAQTDPAIVFPDGSREVKFNFAPGNTEATFDGAPEAILQTGTTAGTLRLEAVTDSGTNTETVRFDPRPVVIEEAVARRNGSTLEIDLTGFDNTRGVGSLNFRFFDRSGSAIGGVISAAPAEQFKNYFDQSAVGGVFRLRAAFPVTGDATIVGSVLIEVANSIGRTDVPRLNFP
ncbi:MAG TPA: choice-of-anchor D domain-containing protein [Bryobacteraceae bacterium]|nr:choice-of-anchor D domain-containing protein [Bryobacteraceae bacterium]